MALSAIVLCGCTPQPPAHPDGIAASYRCDNGQHVRALYLPPDAARITIGERSIDMHIAVSASGARYVGGGLTWWTKGSGPGSRATLFTYDAATGTTGERMTRCVQSTEQRTVPNMDPQTSAQRTSGLARGPGSPIRPAVSPVGPGGWPKQPAASPISAS